MNRVQGPLPFGRMDPITIMHGDIAPCGRRCKRARARFEISLLSSADQHAMVLGGVTFDP
jgi:hypothetical protein